MVFEDLCLEYNLTMRVLKFNYLHEKVLSAWYNYNYEDTEDATLW